MISLQEVHYTYPRSAVPVLSGFSGEFRQGEMVAVTGPNGCGKTTLSRLISGMLRPAKGRIEIDGTDTAGMDLFQIGQRLGYVFQNPDRQLFCTSVFEEVAYGLRNQGLPEERVKELVQEQLERFHLSHHSEDFPLHLSVGEKQRLMLAAVLALGTDYLLLDEPTTGLDVRGRRELGLLLDELRRERGCGVIFISHEASFVERWADREVAMG